MIIEHNILIGAWTEEEKKLLFSPIDADVFHTFPDNTRWPDLLRAFGIFPSTTQAKKNGWDKDVPLGWTEQIFKRNKGIDIHKFYIWKSDGNLFL